MVVMAKRPMHPKPLRGVSTNHKPKSPIPGFTKNRKKTPTKSPNNTPKKTPNKDEKTPINTPNKEEKTPMKTPNKGKKTPMKTPNKGNGTPGMNGKQTPMKQGKKTPKKMIEGEKTPQGKIDQVKTPQGKIDQVKTPAQGNKTPNKGKKTPNKTPKKTPEPVEETMEIIEEETMEIVEEKTPGKKIKKTPKKQAQENETPKKLKKTPKKQENETETPKNQKKQKKNANKEEDSEEEIEESEASEDAGSGSKGGKVQLPPDFKYEENNLMTEFEGVWVRKKAVKGMKEAFEAKKAALRNARKDGKEVERLSESEKAQFEQFVSRKKRTEEKKLRLVLLRVEKAKLEGKTGKPIRKQDIAKEKKALRSKARQMKLKKVLNKKKKKLDPIIVKNCANNLIIANYLNKVRNSLLKSGLQVSEQKRRLKQASNRALLIHKEKGNNLSIHDLK